MSRNEHFVMGADEVESFREIHVDVSKVYAGENDEERDSTRYCNNSILTAKYTRLNFIPLVISMQLKRPSTQYFLFIAILQCIQEISNTNGVPTILIPLTIVMICSAIKEALEYKKRHEADRIANSRMSQVYLPNCGWKDTLWSQIVVGDLVRVKNDGMFPADMIILTTEVDEQERPQDSDENEDPTHSGNCYVETKSLDGETNLKLRRTIPTISDICIDKLNSGEGWQGFKVKHELDS